MNYKSGDIIKFTYTGNYTNSNFKEVLVVHPLWNGLTHAIDLAVLTEAERMVIRVVMDPKTKRTKEGRQKAATLGVRIPLIQNILRRMDPAMMTANPLSLYRRFIVPFLGNKNAYRTYTPSKMSAVQIIRYEDVSSSPSTNNAKPLFGK